MKRIAPQPKTVLETILDWSKDRPAWQRDALRRIVSKGQLDNADLKELLDLCKQGRGASGLSQKPDTLAKSHLPANPGQGATVSVLSIADVSGLPPLRDFKFVVLLEAQPGLGSTASVGIPLSIAQMRRARPYCPSIRARK